jgi:hypothetical protein
MNRFRAIVLLALLAVLLAGCGEGVVIVVRTATPGPTATSIATEPPTPTQEADFDKVLDCQTLTVEESVWRVVNANYCFMVFGSSLYVEKPGGTSDGRQWARLEEYQIIYEPGNVNTPPWVFWYDLGGSHPRGLRMEISQVNGHFGYSQSGTYIQAGRRYVLKLEGVSEVVEAQQANVGLGGRLHLSDGTVVDLPPRYVTQMGPVEVLWVIESDDWVSMRWDAWLNITWASAFGAYTWQGMLVMGAPADDWGEDVVIRF